MNTTLNLLIKSPQKSVSTLLIPQESFQLLRNRIRIYGSIAKFLHYAVKMPHPIFFKHKRNLGKGKIKYQANRQLIRVNFRPNEDDWEILRSHAYMMRISMTYLFVLLLLAIDDKKDGGPTIIKKLTLIQHITLSPPYTYIEIKRFLL